MKKTVEQTISRVFSSLRASVFSFTKKNKKTISSRLDALVVEKAKEQGIELQLKRGFPVFKIATALFGGLAVLGSLAVLVMFVPGPWTRFFAKPQVISMAMQTVQYTENGAIINEQSLIVESPKAIRGVQYVTSNLTVEPAIKYAVSLSEDKTKIVIVPSEALTPGTTYKVTLEPGVLFDDSTYLVNEQSWVIPTKAIFDIVSVSPRNGATAAPNSTIQIHFTTDEFEVADALTHVTIFPSIEGTFSKVSNRLVFVPKQKLTIGGSYTVRVSKELTGTTGQKLSRDIEATFVVSEGVSDTVTVPYIEAEKVFYNHSGKNRNIQAYVESVKALRAEAYRVTWEEIRPYIERSLADQVLFSAATVLEGKTPEARLTIGTSYVDGTFGSYSIVVPEKEGIYLIKLYDAANPALVRYIVSFRSHIGVYASPKVDNTKMDVWAFDYTTKRANAGVRIDSSTCTNTCTTNTTITPENGYVLVENNAPVSYIFAEKEEGAVFLTYGWNPAAHGMFADSNVFSKVILNKPTYLPQDQVKYTVLLREKGETGEYQYPSSESVFVVALCRQDMVGSGSQGLAANCIAQKELRPSIGGQISGVFSTWDRNENLALTIYRKNTSGQLEFVTSEVISIYESDKPQVQLSLKTDKSQYSGRDTMVISGRVTNYTDSGIAGKPVFISIGMYDADVDVQTSVKTDAQGNYSYTYVLPWESVDEYLYDISVSAYTPDSDSEVARYSSVTWTRGDDVSVVAKIGSREVMYVGKNDTVQLLLQATRVPSAESITKNAMVKVQRTYSVEIQGEPYYDEETRKTIVPISYTEEQETVYEKSVIIEKDKGAVITIQQPKDGTYTVIVNEEEQNPWKISQEYEVFYSSSDYADTLDSINEWVTNVSFSKETVAVGEKVQLDIAHTFKADTSDLILLQKTGDVSSWRKIDYKTKSLEIPITKEMRGGLEVCVLYPMEVFSFSEEGSGIPVSLGNIVNDGCASITVEDKSKKLSLTLQPENTTILPGTTSKMDLTVTDAQNQAKKSVVGVSVVDKAVYDEYLQGVSYKGHILNLYQELYETFTAYSTWGMYSTSLQDVMPGGAGSGSDDDTAAVLRKDFEVNPYWNATIETDDQGKAQISIPYSDSVTTWVVLVWAATEDLQVGTNTVEVKTQKDTYIEVDTPAVLRLGDTWVPYVRVSNSTPGVFAGTVTLSCEGCLEGTVEQKISVPGNQTVDITVPSKVTKEGVMTFKAVVSQNGKAIDAVETPVRVKPVGVPVAFEQRGVVSSENSSLKMNLPATVSIAHSDVYLSVSQAPVLPEIQVSGSVATSPHIVQALQVLIKNKSRGSLGGYATKEELDAAIRVYAYALGERSLADGSFAYTSDGGTDYGATIAAGYGLLALKSVDNELHVLDTMILSKYIDYLSASMLSDGFDKEVKAEMAYLLASLDPNRAVRLVTAFAHAIGTEENTSTVTVLTALALQRVGATSDASALVSKAMATHKVDSAGSTAYIDGTRRDLLTSMQLYLISTLNMNRLYTKEIAPMQSWIEKGCTECSTSWYGALVAEFYEQSLAQNELGSAKAEKVAVSINGKEAGSFEYDGISSTYRLPSEHIVPGENTISVTTASGKKLYIIITGDLLLTSVDQREETSIATKIELVEVNKNRILSLGSSGHYKITLTANKDIPPGQVEISLPVGLRYKYVWLPAYDAIWDQVMYAYGDQTRTETVQAYVPAMKKGEVVYVVVPFSAVRVGSYSGLTAYFSFGDSVVTSVSDTAVSIR